ncbi:MAG: hypothetical protein BMS9Abin02_0782 [Anaerolineae bacterium]|nr:MAG: hypothetical protein BMS9Abin02_0782 [Anaerolineae bacterium]
MMNRDIIARFESTLSIILFILGVVICFISVGAEIIGLDLTPGFGMVQMFQLLIGLTLLTFAGFLKVHSMRPPNAPKSLQADVGIRLGATGLVFAYVSGLSDLIGIGTHIVPEFSRPYVGPLQLGSLIVGVLIVTVGLLLYFTSKGTRESSSLESLLPNNH